MKQRSIVHCDARICADAFANCDFSKKKPTTFYYFTLIGSILSNYPSIEFHLNASLLRALNQLLNYLTDIVLVD